MVEQHLLNKHDPLRPYNLTESTEDILENYQSRTYDLSLEMEREYFKGQLKDGFFIEAGASSGRCRVIS